MRKIAVYYHKSDLDGLCSAAVVHYWLKYHAGYSHEVSFIGVDYGDKPSHAPDVDEVYVLDFSFPPATMLELHKRHYLIWLDHHETAIAANFERNFAGHRDMLLAGCELTWDYLFPLKSRPAAVTMLGRYDVWDHKYNPDVKPFQFGMRFLGLSYDSQEWVTLFGDNRSKLYREVCCTGGILIKWDVERNGKAARDYCYDSTLRMPDREYAVIVQNCNKGSQHFDSLWDSDTYDLMCAWKYNGQDYTVSLYSTCPDVHCGEIAKTFGGGGHRGAAGFLCKELPAWVLARE